MRRKEIRIFEEKLMEREENRLHPPERQSFLPALRNQLRGPTVQGLSCVGPEPSAGVHGGLLGPECSAQRWPLPWLTGHFPLRVWQSTLARKPPAQLPAADCPQRAHQADH